MDTAGRKPAAGTKSDGGGAISSSFAYRGLVAQRTVARRSERGWKIVAPHDGNPAPHRRLRMGSRGKDVKMLQHTLNLRAKRKRMGTRVVADGELGPKTRALWLRLAPLLGFKHNLITVRHQSSCAGLTSGRRQ